MNHEHGNVNLLPDADLKYGPVAWCKFCSRYHPRRKHDLILGFRTAKSGKTVTRWVHKEKK